ncbi:MAG: ABC transporter permease [Candidatus Moraniibacteriota bacterium]
MFILDNIELATRNFKTRKLRSFLTVLGISVGIGTILFLVSLGYGLQKVLIEKIATSDALLTLDVTSSDPKMIKIDNTMLDGLSKTPNVAGISPQKTGMTLLRIEDISTSVTTYAVNESFLKLSGVSLAYGEMFRGSKDNKIIISSATAKLLGVQDAQEALGKKVEITLIVLNDSENVNTAPTDESENIPLEETFYIGGIISDDSNNFCFMPLGWFDGVGADSYDQLKVKVTAQSQLENVRTAMIEKGLSVSALSDTVDQANKIFSVVQIILAVFGVVALLVSAIGMFNTMTIALLERTVEIGIMKSLGAANREIRLLFLTESIIIGFLGGSSGILLGLLACQGFNRGINLLAKNLGGQSIDVFYTPLWFMIFILTFSTLVGLFTGIYPAQRAAKLNSLEALRYK